MPRHQIFQLGSAIIIGLLIGGANRLPKFPKYIPGVSSIIFFMGSLIFWMIPLSVDLSVVSPKLNYLRLINIIIAAFLIQQTMRNTSLEIKVIFYVALTSKLIGVGLVLSNLNILLCSTFTIGQQNTTGHYLIAIGVLSLFATYATFLKETKNKKPPQLD